MVLFGGLLLILGGTAWALYRFTVQRCGECRFRVKPATEVIDLPARDKPGLSVTSYTCKRCGYSESRRVVTWYGRFMLLQALEVLGSIWKNRRRRKRREKRKRRFLRRG